MYLHVHKNYVFTYYINMKEFLILNSGIQNVSKWEFLNLEIVFQSIIHNVTKEKKSIAKGG